MDLFMLWMGPDADGQKITHSQTVPTGTHGTHALTHYALYIQLKCDFFLFNVFLVSFFIFFLLIFLQCEGRQCK